MSCTSGTQQRAVRHGSCDSRTRAHLRECWRGPQRASATSSRPPRMQRQPNRFAGSGLALAHSRRPGSRHASRRSTSSRRSAQRCIGSPRAAPGARACGLLRMRESDWTAEPLRSRPIQRSRLRPLRRGPPADGRGSSRSVCAAHADFTAFEAANLLDFCCTDVDERQRHARIALPASSHGPRPQFRPEPCRYVRRGSRPAQVSVPRPARDCRPVPPATAWSWGLAGAIAIVVGTLVAADYRGVAARVPWVLGASRLGLRFQLMPWPSSRSR